MPRTHQFMCPDWRVHLRSVQTSLFGYLYKSWQAAALWKANLTSTTTNSCFSLQVPTCRLLFPCFPLILMQLASECLENLSSILKSLEFWSISIFNTNRCNVNCVCPSVGSYDYTKDDVKCYLLFGVTKCYNCLLCISSFTNHGWIGCLDTIDH